MRFILEFDCENDAFDYDAESESVDGEAVANILREVADAIGRPGERLSGWRHHRTVYGLNGDPIGLWRLG